jgi:hypothetical protein
MLTPMQRTALAWPCARAEETAHPRFRRVRWPVSMILTVDL